MTTDEVFAVLKEHAEGVTGKAHNGWIRPTFMRRGVSVSRSTLIRRLDQLVAEGRAERRWSYRWVHSKSVRGLEYRPVNASQ